MFNYFIQCISLKYLNFSDRSRRKEFWSFVLFRYIINVAIALHKRIYVEEFISTEEEFRYTIILFFIFIAFLLPSIAVSIRRMHDVGKSGWYMLIPIYNIILCFTDSEPGENEYGPNPKGIGNTDDADVLIQSIGQ